MSVVALVLKRTPLLRKAMMLFQHRTSSRYELDDRRHTDKEGFARFKPAIASKRLAGR